MLFIAALIGESFGALIGGGSLVTMPAILFTGTPLTSAIAIDNGAAIGTEAGIFSETRKKVLARKKLLVLMAVPLTLGGVIGTWLLLNVPGDVIKYLMAGTIILIVVHAYLSRNKPKKKVIGVSNYVFLVLFLFVIGIYSNFMAAGEGAFSRMGIMAIVGLTFLQSQGIKATATMPSRIYSLIVTAFAGLIVWPYMLALWAGGFLAGKYSTRAVKHVPDRLMKIALTVVSILFVIYLLFFY